MRVVRVRVRARHGVLLIVANDRIAQSQFKPSSSATSPQGPATVRCEDPRRRELLGEG
jgi:hypothetical protein